jgi:phage gp46-like protein
MSDRKLDPVTGDFRSAPGGAFEQCDVIENQIAFSYKIPVGSWEGDPELGHRFGELDRAQNTLANRNRARELARLAVQWLIDLASIESVDAIVESIGAEGVAFEVDYYLPGAQKPRKAGPFLVPVGGG